MQSIMMQANEIELTEELIEPTSEDDQFLE
jgi:hypothetical protein